MRENEFNWYADLGDGNYRNPILYTDYSDPDAIRVGDDCVIILQYTGTSDITFKGSGELEGYKLCTYQYSF